MANEDVVSYDGTTFSLAFDGSDVGLASRRIDAFGWLNSTTLLFSLDTDGATLPGVAGTIDDSDVIRFDATSLGTTTSGAFSVYFDGSDVGLTTSGEDVDAFELLSNGTIVLSTDGSASVPGVSSGAEDLLVFTPSSLGSTTSGSVRDVLRRLGRGHLDLARERRRGRRRRSRTRVPVDDRKLQRHRRQRGRRGRLRLHPTTLGATTSGTFSSTLYFDGSAFGLGGNDIAAIDLPLGT